MQAFEFILENWSSRETAQVALKFGLLLLPIALWLWVPGFRRRHERLVVTLGVVWAVNSRSKCRRSRSPKITKWSKHSVRAVLTNCSACGIGLCARIGGRGPCP